MGKKSQKFTLWSTLWPIFLFLPFMLVLYALMIAIVPFGMWCFANGFDYLHKLIFSALKS